MRWIAAMAATLLVVRPCATGAESPLVEVRTVVEQWVQTRQLISRTQADWEAEKEMLVQTKALYERELAGIETQMSKVSTNSVQVDREREAAEKDLKESVETLDHATGVMAGLEARVRAMTGRLPSPLVETMQPLLARLPEEGKPTKVSVTERVQTVVSLLNEIDKFNNAVGIYSEKRANGKGEDVSVETVYLGLGSAYFVNQTGEFSGSGSPSEKAGWEWIADPSLAAPVREVIRIYRGERTATFVPLPVTLR